MFLIVSLIVSNTQGEIIYVDDDASGANNGTSWIDAYNDLQDALSIAQSGDEILVAQGIYKPYQDAATLVDREAISQLSNVVDTNEAFRVHSYQPLHLPPPPPPPPPPASRTATFQLKSGVVFKGGYAGAGFPDPNARDIEKYESILSGDLNGDDAEINDPCDLLNDPCRSENSFHVVTSNGTNTKTVLDGFTITAGNSNKLQYQRGGGIYNESGSPTLTNCTFTVNSAITGGGMSNESGSPRLTNCTFAANWAMSGGGISNGPGSPKLTKCKFVGNNSSWHGGGIYNADSISVMSCIFIGNTSQCGGGMYNEYYIPSSVLINCIFVGNSVKAGGGGIFNGLSDLILMNCTFVGNSAEDRGGGFYIPPLPIPSVSSSSTAYDGYSILKNCIFWDNLPEQIVNLGSGISVEYSNIQGGWRGFGNINEDPCFVDKANGDYHLKSQAGRWDPNSQSWGKDDVTSPCIDAGNPGCPVGDEPESNGNRRNMGAYGGTAEASKSPPYWRSIADMTNDWIVDSSDLKVFVDYWLRTGECIPGDFDRNQFVDSNDFAIFGGQWRQIGPGPGIAYDIGGCIPVDFPSSEVVEVEPTRFTVTVEGQYILFEDMMQANCCPEELDVQMTVEDDLITIYEIERFFTRVPCPCICDYPITATLGPFEPGVYILEVYQDAGFIGTTTVTIGPGG